MKLKRKLAMFISFVFLLTLAPMKTLVANAADSDTRKSYESSNESITFTGTWKENTDKNNSDGSSKYSETKGDSITFQFEGTGFALYGLVNENSGIMDVTIDDGFTSKIDLYSSSEIYKKNLYEAYNLKSGKHSVKIDVTGNKNSASKGNVINLDYLEIIGGTLTETTNPPDPEITLTAGTISASVSSSTDGNYSITATAPAKNAAVSYDVFEGSKSIKSGSLTANSDKAETIKIDLKDKADGSYAYKLVLKDANGKTIDSNTVTVTVKREIVNPDTGNTSVKRVITYFPNWGIYNGAHQSMQVSQIPWEKVTCVNHAFFTIDKEFNLVSTDPDADFDRIMAHGEGWGALNGHMAEYKYYKTQYPNVDIMISVGGWTRGENFHDMAKTPETRKKFINSCVEFLKKYPFIDGIDIDWEYPGVDRDKDPNDQYDYGCPGGPEDAENFPAFLKEMREAFKSNGLSNKKLTAAVAAGKDKIDLVPPNTYEQYLDYLNVMTYDFHGAWENVTGHHSPLYGSGDNEPYDDLIKNYYNVDSAMKEYVAAGVAKDKLTVGTPYYSRGWKGVDTSKGVTINGTFCPGLYQPATGAWTGGWDNPSVPGGQEGWFTVKKFETQAGWEKHRDPINNSPYLINKNSGIFLTYEDQESLTQKLDYINKNNFGGIIIWEISGDELASGAPLTTLCYNKMVKEPLDALPKKVELSVDSSTNKGSYNLTADIPANSKATSYQLYEGDKIVKSGDVNTSAQKVTYSVSNKAVGEYSYRLVLKNSAGVTKSEIVKVTVIDVTTPSQGTLKVDKPVNDGNFTLTLTTTDDLATDYKIYANDKVVAEGKVNGKTTTIEMKDVAYATYNYKAELINSATGKSSFTNPIEVRCKIIPKEWSAGTTYKAGDLVIYKNVEYQCVIGHMALEVWTPDGGGSTLWKAVDSY